MPSATLIASLDTPVMIARSLRRMPSWLSTRITFALIASDRSDSFSKSIANVSSTFERRACSNRPDLSPSRFAATGRSGPRLKSPYPRIGRQSGSSVSNLPTSSPNDSLRYSTASLPNRSCHRLSIPSKSGCHTLWASRPAAVARTNQDQRGVGAVARRIGFQHHVPSSLHARQVRCCPCQNFQLSDRYFLLGDKAHAI